MTRYSQDNEQDVILEHFGNRVGRFLDIGAADGVHFSNTRALAERGWGGVLVEPSPRQFLELFKLYKDVRGIELFNGALTRDGQIATFYYSPDTVVNTVNPLVHEQWSRSFAYSRWKIPTCRVYDFLIAYPGPYDFISVDAEGESWGIANECILHMKPSLACIEHDSDRARYEFIMAGYEKVLENGNNTIWKLRA